MDDAGADGVYLGEAIPVAADDGHVAVARGRVVPWGISLDVELERCVLVLGGGAGVLSDVGAVDDVLCDVED